MPVRAWPIRSVPSRATERVISWMAKGVVMPARSSASQISGSDPELAEGGHGVQFAFVRVPCGVQPNSGSIERLPRTCGRSRRNWMTVSWPPARARPHQGAGQAAVDGSILSVVGCMRIVRNLRDPAAFQDPEYREAVVDLLGAISYGEISAFERLAEDSKMAPAIRDKMALATMASAGVRARRAAARPARRAGRRPVRRDGAVHRADREVPPPHRAGRLVRGAGQGVRRRRAGRGLLPRDRGVPRQPRPATWSSPRWRTPARPTSSSSASGRRSRPSRRSAAGWRCGAGG